MRNLFVFLSLKRFYFIPESNNIVLLIYWFSYESLSALNKKKKKIIGVCYYQCYYIILYVIFMYRMFYLKSISIVIFYNNYNIEMD